jgi:predicted RNase H-like HicB family nuclease
MASHQFYEAIIHPEEDGTFWAEVPSLPGCFTQGKTLESIKAHLQEAISLHLECLCEEGQPVPLPDTDQQFHQLRIATVQSK